MDTQTAKSFEEMYSQNAASIGRDRGADTDWKMFGFYIANNIGVVIPVFCRRVVRRPREPLFSEPSTAPTAALSAAT